MVLVAATSSKGRDGIDFFPLTVDYRERLASAGKFPGGFIKREGRPTTHEILTMRLTDRPIRPLFPKWFRDEVQIMSQALACDGENLPDALSIIGASAALSLAPVPFNGPIAAVRVGVVDGELKPFPTAEDLEESPLDLIVAGSKESILMIEGFAHQMPEEHMVDALAFGHRIIGELCDLQTKLVEAVGVEKPDFPEPEPNPFVPILMEEAADKIREAKTGGLKQERAANFRALKDEIREKFFPEGADETEDGKTVAQLKEALYVVEKKVVRDLILGGTRLDGRSKGEIRDVSCRVGVIPLVHGSSLFTRGETQSLSTLTLGTVRDQQRVEDIFGEHHKRFMLDYNFPPYSVGECRPIRGPGRREIGHGALAERSVQSVIPSADDFPYTIRLISDITESNGSSSMASVCNATLALMDGGVPIKQPVAGISIGLVKEGDDYTLLTDIMGDEDHFGDMDFKVAGTQKGITGIQLDMKIDGINEDIIRNTLAQAREARISLLRSMLSEIRRPRAEISPSAPKLVKVQIDPEKIGALIGPGGKMIRSIQEECEVTIDVDDEGTVVISAANDAQAQEALYRVNALTEEIKVGKIYEGTVISIKDFGAFIEIAPGKDGLCHISELSDEFVKSVADVAKIGDLMSVKVIAVDDQNRVKLSRKAVLAELASDEDGDDDDIDDDDDE